MQDEVLVIIRCRVIKQTNSSDQKARWQPTFNYDKVDTQTEKTTRAELFNEHWYELLMIDDC